jgi:hypothetical protein
MAFNPNKSDEKVFREIKLYTGLHNMKVVAINPTKAQLEEMGYKPQNDPVYLTVEEEVKKLRLDFHLHGESPEGEKIMTKVAFFLENQYRVNREGDKSEWINDFGRTAWSAQGDPENPPTGLTWFKHETARRSHVGEADLHLFLVNWLNIGPDDEAKMDNFLAIFDEDYSELHGLLAGNADNEVRVLLTVRDGKYQSVYNKYFDRASNKRTNYWESHVRNQTSNGYAIKEDYQNSFAFAEWSEPSTRPDTGGAEEEGKKGDDPF